MRAVAAYSNPTRFEDSIRAFETADAKTFPPRGAIVCVGSSTLLGWHPTLREHLAPLTVIPRGFGGSNMGDVLHYADRIVLPYQPRAVLLYEGDNDLAQEVTPDEFMEAVREFAAIVHAQAPATRIYPVSIKPSIGRWNLWPRMEEANRLLAEECARDTRLCYISIVEGMLRPDGTPREDIFVADGVHMNAKGYDVWRAAIRPVLMERESAFEARDGQDCGCAL